MDQIGEATFLKQFVNLAEQLNSPSQYSELQILKRLRRMSSEPCVTPAFLVNEVPFFFNFIFEYLSSQEEDPLYLVDSLKIRLS